MSDTFITAVSVIIIVVLLFAFTIISVSNQNDEIMQTTVETIVSNFVNTAAKEGMITKNNYDDFIQKLYATGNSYDIGIEVQIMHTNVVNEKEKTIGENIYYSVFRNDIETAINNNGSYKLKQGDRVIAKAVNTNVTFGTQMKSLISNIMGKDPIVIQAMNSALVTTTGK